MHTIASQSTYYFTIFQVHCISGLKEKMRQGTEAQNRIIETKGQNYFGLEK